MKPTRICEAAIMTRSGIITGATHRECWASVNTRFGLEGFMTSKRQFVNRHFAGTLALMAGQCINGLKDNQRGLSSDDLTTVAPYDDEALEEIVPNVDDFY